jgi:hypothetical protein
MEQLMKKLIIGTFLLVIHVNLCIGQQLSRFLFTVPPHIEAAVQSANFVTIFLPDVTKVSCVTKETGEAILTAQVEFWHALHSRQGPAANIAAAKTLFLALQNNARARSKDSPCRDLDLKAQVELLGLVAKNEKSFPRGAQELFESRLNFPPVSNLASLHFSMLFLLMHKNSIYYDRKMSSLAHKIILSINRFEGKLATIKASRCPSFQQQFFFSSAEKEVERLFDEINTSTKDPLLKKTIKKSYANFKEKINKEIQKALEENRLKQEKKDQNGEPAAKRQRTTEDS